MQVRYERIGQIYEIKDRDLLFAFSSIPALKKERKEYFEIYDVLGKTYHNSENNRHVFISHGDWKNEKNPSCWTSFSLYKRDEMTTLIANMRSCDVKIFASDLGFLCRLILGFRGEHFRLIWIVGSLHDRGEE